MAPVTNNNNNSKKAANSNNKPVQKEKDAPPVPATSNVKAQPIVQPPIPPPSVAVESIANAVVDKEKRIKALNKKVKTYSIILLYFIKFY